MLEDYGYVLVSQEENIYHYNKDGIHNNTIIINMNTKKWATTKSVSIEETIVIWKILEEGIYDKPVLNDNIVLESIIEKPVEEDKYIPGIAQVVRYGIYETITNKYKIDNEDLKIKKEELVAICDTKEIANKIKKKKYKAKKYIIKKIDYYISI